MTDLLAHVEPITPAPMTDGVALPEGFQRGQTAYAIVDRLGQWHSVYMYEGHAKRARSLRADGKECRIGRVRFELVELLTDPIVSNKSRGKKSK